MRHVFDNVAIDMLCELHGSFGSARQPDFSRMSMLMKEPVIFDGRNIYHAMELEDYGFTYYSVGRPAVRGSSSQQAAA